jgi:Uma2 family endonuclease
MSSDASLVPSELPDIDDRLVVPETRYEMYDGELVYVPPADPPHGNRHLQLSALLEAHTGTEFEAAVDLLTRTSRRDDVAPDISVYPAAPDPRTGRRQLEHLAFEIVSTQTLARAGVKAAKLVSRGVRRVFAIDVEKSRALEWSAALGTWELLDPDGRIEDLALAVPLPIATFIHTLKADNAVAAALLAKGNEVLEAKAEIDRATGWAAGHAEGWVEGRAEGHAEGWVDGHAEGAIAGKAQAVIAILEARGTSLDPTTRERISAERSVDRLDRWIARAATCTTSDELLGDG